MQTNTNQTLKGGEVKQCILIEPVKIVQLTAKVPSEPPDLDFCPSQKKHFFCGIAKSLGCQFCAPK